MAKKEAVEYAATADTATLEHPDSTRDQRAIIQTAPPAIAFKEVQTPSAHTVTDEDGGTFKAYAATRENSQGSEVTKVECPSGHGAGKGEATTGTVGKTATCGECGKLLIPTTLINERTGEPVEFKSGKDGARVAKSTAKAEKAATPKGGKGVEVDTQSSVAAAPKAKKSASKSKSTAKGA